MSFYKKFKESIEQSRERISNNHLKLDENNLGDNNFFAFLNEWLKDLMRYKEENDLIKELKENEALTREKLQLLLKDSLKEYMRLDKEILEQKGLAGLDYEKANKLLSDENFMDFSYELISNKLEKLKEFANTLKEKGKNDKEINEILKKQDLNIKAKDIQSMSAKAGNMMKDKDTQKIVTEAVKIARAVILKK